MTTRLSVIGAGYLGTTHAACLAHLGFEVLCVDRDRHKVDRLARGETPFWEPGLAELVSTHVGDGRLRFATSVSEAAAFADTHFVCVGTPQSKTGPEADVSAVVAVSSELARATRHDCLIVGKSTVPVGTTRDLTRIIAEAARPGITVDLAWNPEFLREGHAVQDTLAPDRLVFGVQDPRAEHTLRAIHARPIAAGAPVHVTDPATAELAKTAANSFLATKISFINAMADLSERSGADVVALADILGADARIGRRFLNAGVGFGGGCLPKDVRALAARADELGASSAARLLRDVDTVNLETRRRTVDLAIRLCGPGREGQRIAVLGAAFKPGSDDVRDSPALAIAGQLQLHGADVRVFDPQAMHTAAAAYPALTYVDSADTALRDADLVLHLTEWPEFGEIDPAHAAMLARGRQLVDGRNTLDHTRWRRAGWTIHALGRGTGPSRQPRPQARLLGRR